MGALLPPVPDVEKLKAELRLVPSRRREDAIQEAWVAHLEGRDVIHAIKAFSESERRFEKRAPGGLTDHAAVVERILEREDRVHVCNETSAPRKSKSSPSKHRAA